MSVGEIAGLVAAISFAVLVVLLAVPILKLGRTVDETTKLVAGLAERTPPLISELDLILRQVNGQLEKVDSITDNASKAATNVAGLTTLFAATLGGPVIKVAAFTFGVRKAVTGRRHSGSRGRRRR